MAEVYPNFNDMILLGIDPQDDDVPIGSLGFDPKAKTFTMLAWSGTQWITPHEYLLQFLGEDGMTSWEDFQHKHGFDKQVDTLSAYERAMRGL